MAATKDFSLLYRTVEQNISKALTDLSKVKIANKKGNQQLDNINKMLCDLQGRFKKEIDFLEENSEWEKFTIAFFGETNAGKSTIIESLRIIFNEKSRQELINRNKANLEYLELKFSKDSDNLIEELNKIYQGYTNEVIMIANEISSLSEISKREFGLKKKVIRLSIAAAIGFVAGLLFSVVAPDLFNSIRVLLFP
jgi:hypothetical protein